MCCCALASYSTRLLRVPNAAVHITQSSTVFLCLANADQDGSPLFGKKTNMIQLR